LGFIGPASPAKLPAPEPGSPHRGAAARSHDREARKGGGRRRGREGFPRRGRRCLAATAVAGIFIEKFYFRFLFTIFSISFAHKFCSEILFKNFLQKFPNVFQNIFLYFFTKVCSQTLWLNKFFQQIFVYQVSSQNFLFKILSIKFPSKLFHRMFVKTFPLIF
jgi:hypothetical protein